MTTTAPSAVEPTAVARWRSLRWVLLAVVVIVGLALLTTYLTAPRPGGPMDPQSTSEDGARALVTLLRDAGVDVVEAGDSASVARAARPDTLIVVAQTYHFMSEDVLRRIDGLPGDLLLVEPTSRAREVFTPELRLAGGSPFGRSRPGCDLRAATRAGDVNFGLADTYQAVDDTTLISCYDDALVRYSRDGRTITVVGGGGFMTNSGLLKAGNAALAMNLVGTNARVIWYAPQSDEGESAGGVEASELIPDRASWIALQLCLVVVLVALWKGRRLGPLVAERLPVVVRASETVEGRGRLYRAQRARDRAADALRTATLQRMLPRLGLANNAEPPAVVTAIAERCGLPPPALAHHLFGPPPAGDDELVNLARELDNIERQVAQS